MDDSYTRVAKQDENAVFAWILLGKFNFAPVAQLDRASDYGFNKELLRAFSLGCAALPTLGVAGFRIRAALRRIAQFCR